jgi:hypothetical protein
MRRGQAMKEIREIGRIVAISVKCEDCNKVFPMNRGEIMWYSNRGYPFPKRCPDCRKKRKEAKEREKKADANTRDSE